MLESNIITYIIERVGFDNAMRIKNFFIFLAGASCASIVTKLIVLRAVYAIKRDERARGAALIRINGQLLSCPNELYEYYETFWAWVSWNLTGRKNKISFRDVRAGKRLSIFAAILAVISIIIGFWFMLVIDAANN